MSLSIDISEAITRNLPAELGATLQKRLKQADADKLDLDAAKEKLALLIKRIAELEVNAKTANELAQTRAELSRRADELRISEDRLNHRLEIASIKQAAAESAMGHVKDVVSLVFCSPVSRRQITENINRPTVNRDGYQNGNITETRTVDEESTGPGLQG